MNKTDAKRTETPDEYMARIKAKCKSHTPIGIFIASLQKEAEKLKARR